MSIHKRILSMVLIVAMLIGTVSPVEADIIEIGEVQSVSSEEILSVDIVKNSVEIPIYLIR